MRKLFFCNPALFFYTEELEQLWKIIADINFFRDFITSKDIFYKLEFLCKMPHLMDFYAEYKAELGITNLSAYLRKMAVDGYIVHLDMSEIRELTRLLRICSNNLNQYAKRAHESGNVYAADIDDLRTRLDELWETADGLLRGFANIP